MRPTRAFRLFVLLFALLLVGWLALFLTAEQSEAPGTAARTGQTILAALDIGQGDSIFVLSPSRKTMLIDAGNGRSDVEDVILPYLESRGVSRIDYLVLTHPDQDHVGGMPVLLDSIEVGSFLDSVQPGATNRAYAETLRKVRDKRINAVRVRTGMPAIDLGPPVSAEILGPTDPLITSGDSESNNNSVVLRLVHGSVSALLTADIEEEAEQRIIASGMNLRSDILKVAHHGSRYGTSGVLLDFARPEVALISVGAGNPYDHPHPQLLERLSERGIDVLRTDQLGTIEVQIDGQSYTVVADRQGR